MKPKDDLVQGACSGNLRLVLSALKRGANPNARHKGRTVLIWAVQEQYLNVIKALVRANVSLDARDSNGFTAIDQAVGEGSFDIVKFLLKSGADVNGRTANGSPLHTACAWKRLKIARLLLQNGADPNILDEESRKPIDLLKRSTNASDKALKKILIKSQSDATRS